jgi:DNA-binding transcriptional ArsR family regulator
MIEGPDISIVAALIGNPASANMLLALMAGPALTSTELAQEAGLSLATTSGHLARLEKARLVTIERQGRHRYYRLADDAVARALEGLLPLAERAGHLRTRPGPRDPQLRYARSCYDHMAGDLAVQMYDHFISQDFMTREGDDLNLTDLGRAFFVRNGIVVAALEPGQRRLCRPCLDWSERRCHLSGMLGAAIFSHFLSQRWATRELGVRVVHFGRDGERAIRAWFSEDQSAPSAAGLLQVAENAGALG